MNDSATPRTGRPPADASDIQRRRELWQQYRQRLGGKAADIAAVTGLTPATVRWYSGPSNVRNAPSESVLMLMRAELLRRARQAVLDAEAASVRASEEVAELEQEHFMHIVESEAA